MNASVKLQAYISLFAERWRQFLLGRGALFALCTFTLVSLVAAYLAVESGFDQSYFWLGRLALILFTAIAVYLVLFKPLKSLAKNLATEIEQREPDFSGRIMTFSDSEAEQGGLRDLLAADALTIGEQSPVQALISKRELAWPYFATGVVGLFLIAMLIAGPGMMNHSLRYLYAGWAFNELLPPQQIHVSPGDAIVKRGGNLKLSAKADGFKSEELVLHVKTGDSDWQQINMNPLPNSDGGYDFSLFSIRDSLEYYVTSDAIRTPNFNVDVIDLPGISSVKLTYEYPDWTQLQDEVHERIGDIAVLPGTKVSLEVFTDSALPAGELVLNGEPLSLSIDTESEQPRGFTDFVVEQEGDYYLAAVIGGDQVRLSDDYFISLLEDQKPEIEFAFPSRDWNASNIEEVLTEVSVKDDFGVEQVELSYAVNGGEWQTIDLKANNEFEFVKDQEQLLDHLFFLEEFTVEEPIYEEPIYEEPAALTQTDEAVNEVDPFAELGISNPLLDGQSLEPITIIEEEPLVEAIVIGTETKPLQPGDLISYYAKVSDRQSTEQTDIFFIEVQPFDRRFSQAEQGGGLGGGQGERDLEISERQREIIVSTWNLIREQNDSTADQDELADRLNDSTKLLAQLQRSLAEQAQSLVETARSRQLTADQRIETYAEHIDNAIKAMGPASEELLNLNLTDAIGPEQAALQHLLRADAVFNEVQVSINNSGQGGQGGGARQELAEMFELEIDMDRNQYETGSRASLSEEEEETDETMQALEELAQRQQQLANNLRNNQQISEAEQYQQEQLRREAEQLQARIDRLQQQQQANAQAQGQAQQGGEQSDQQGNDSELAQQETSELNRRLQSAMDAMERASEAMRNGDAEQLQRDAGEAQRQLQGAGEQLSDNQSQARQQAFEEMASTAAELYDEQVKMEEVLLDGVQKAVASADPITETVTSPFSYPEEVAMADQKVAMLERLQRLKADLVNNATRVKTELPRIARTLENADADLKESEVAIRMNLAADYMRRGEALYVANSEGLTTNALRSLRDSTEQALRALSSDGIAEQSELDRIMDDLRAGRAELQDLAEQAQGGEAQSGRDQSEAQAGQNQTESQQQGQAGEGGQASDSQELAQGESGQGEGQGQQGGQGTQQGQGAQAGGQPGQGNNQGGFAGGANAGGNWGDWTGARGFSPDMTENLNREMVQALSGASNLMPELRDRGVSEAQLDDIRDLVQELQNRGFAGGTQDLSLVELNDTLALLEELEARVDQGLQGDAKKVRTDSAVEIPTEYREAVADYYRRLSDDKLNQQP